MRDQTLAIFDGYNFFKGTRRCFGNDFGLLFDPWLLAQRLTRNHRALPADVAVEFHIGSDDQLANQRVAGTTWRRKFGQLNAEGDARNQGRVVQTSGIQSHFQRCAESHTAERCDAGAHLLRPLRKEKGTDVKIAAAIVRAVLQDQYNGVIVFSADRDLVAAIKVAVQIRRLSDPGFNVFNAYPTCDIEHARRCHERLSWTVGLAFGRDLFAETCNAG